MQPPAQRCTAPSQRCRPPSSSPLGCRPPEDCGHVRDIRFPHRQQEFGEVRIVQQFPPVCRAILVQIAHGLRHVLAFRPDDEGVMVQLLAQRNVLADDGGVREQRRQDAELLQCIKNIGLADIALGCESADLGLDLRIGPLSPQRLPVGPCALQSGTYPLLDDRWQARWPRRWAARGSEMRAYCAIGRLVSPTARRCRGLPVAEGLRDAKVPEARLGGEAAPHRRRAPGRARKGLGRAQARFRSVESA